MIIPRGSLIEVDVHGQLSIRAPGNLVIQNSGNYGTIESLNGSIRIESEAEVEAVNVRCQEACFVEGSLTAWKLVARSLHLQERARANIVLQETRELEIGRDARLVGNFGSEKELFVLFSRFANQLRSLPLFAGRRREPDSLEAPAAAEDLLLQDAGQGDTGEASSSREGAAAEKREEELSDPLFFALILLEREFGLSSHGPTSQRAIEELIKLLRARDTETLGLTYRTLFGRIVEPGRDVVRARELVAVAVERAGGGGPPEDAEIDEADEAEDGAS
jgi:hypothetical protein